MGLGCAPICAETNLLNLKTKFINPSGLLLTKRTIDERRNNYKTFRHYVGESSFYVRNYMKQYIQKYSEWVGPTSKVYSKLPQLILEVMEFADKFSETLTREQKLAVINFFNSQKAVFQPIVDKVEEDSRLSQTNYVATSLTESFGYTEIREGVFHGDGPIVVITASEVICGSKIFKLHDYYLLTEYLEEHFTQQEQAC